MEQADKSNNTLTKPVCTLLLVLLAECRASLSDASILAVGDLKLKLQHVTAA